MTDAQKVDLSAFIGVKEGMTRIFDKEGNHVAVTVIKLIPNIVSQVKTDEKDNYQAYQIAYYEKRESLVIKPMKGHLKKAGIEKTFSRFLEIKDDVVDVAHLGKQVSYKLFSDKVWVDASSISKGKGFQGVVKRYNFQGGPATHGSHFHRRAGSIGNRATPGRVFPEKKMPGQMGSKRVTVQNLQVVGVNEEKGYMLISGAVPGSRNNFIKISIANKK